MNEPQVNGAEAAEMARWQGRIEATIESIRFDMEGRDARYTERAESQDKAVSAALAAQKEAVAAALAASDKAVEKAEQTAEKWRESANEWRGAMSDRDRELPSRREVNAEVMRLEAMIAPLAISASNQQGRVEQRVETRQSISVGQGLIALILTVILVALAVYASGQRSPAGGSSTSLACSAADHPTP